jgi:hydroxymethylbilane synthase
VRRLRLGTRGSRLARAQSAWVAERLARAAPDTTIELVAIETYGDLHRDAPLAPELGQSFFTKEIEEALLAGRIDLAVHSCKDLSTTLPAGLALAAVPAREDPRDVLVSRVGRLAELPAGARVGTCSPRRRGFLASLRPDVVAVDLRGNVPTRVRAVAEGRMEAALLAAAGLARLGMADRITETLDPISIVPAAAQGALALQTRSDDVATTRLAALLDDAASRLEVTAERACLARLEAGCHSPLGVLARASNGRLALHVALAAPSGVVRASVDVPLEEDVALGHRPAAAGARVTASLLSVAETAGARAAEALLERLGLASLRDVTWAGGRP